MSGNKNMEDSLAISSDRTETHATTPLSSSRTSSYVASAKSEDTISPDTSVSQSAQSVSDEDIPFEAGSSPQRPPFQPIPPSIQSFHQQNPGIYANLIPPPANRPAPPAPPAPAHAGGDYPLLLRDAAPREVLQPELIVQQVGAVIQQLPNEVHIAHHNMDDHWIGPVGRGGPAVHQHFPMPVVIQGRGNPIARALAGVQIGRGRANAVPPAFAIPMNNEPQNNGIDNVGGQIMHEMGEGFGENDLDPVEDYYRELLFRINSLSGALQSRIFPENDHMSLIPQLRRDILAEAGNPAYRLIAEEADRRGLIVNEVVRECWIEWMLYLCGFSENPGRPF